MTPFRPDPKHKRIALNRNSVAWKKLVLEVFKRDGYRCADCGRVFPFEYLAPCHIRSVGAGGSDVAGNLQTKCKSCHGREHMGLKPNQETQNKFYDQFISEMGL